MNINEEELDFEVIENIEDKRMTTKELQYEDNTPEGKVIKSISTPVIEVIRYNGIISKLTIDRSSLEGVREIIKPGGSQHYNDRCLILRKDSNGFVVKGNYERIYNLIYPDKNKRIAGFKRN